MRAFARAVLALLILAVMAATLVLLIGGPAVSFAIRHAWSRDRGAAQPEPSSLEAAVASLSRQVGGLHHQLDELSAVQTRALERVAPSRGTELDPVARPAEPTVAALPAPQPPPVAPRPTEAKPVRDTPSAVEPWVRQWKGSFEQRGQVHRVFSVHLTLEPPDQQGRVSGTWTSSSGKYSATLAVSGRVLRDSFELETTQVMSAGHRTKPVLGRFVMSRNGDGLSGTWTSSDTKWDIFGPVSLRAF